MGTCLMTPKLNRVIVPVQLPRVEGHREPPLKEIRQLRRRRRGNRPPGQRRTRGFTPGVFCLLIP